MRARNPAWSREELTLSLDFYLDDPNPSKKSPALLKLASTIKAIALTRGASDNEKLRNLNGVYSKLQNWKNRDPIYRNEGKKGLTNGNKLEPEIWAFYKDRCDQLRTDAQAIRDALAIAQTWPQQEPIPDSEYEGSEGCLHLVLHKRYERDAKLVREKKKAAKGNFACEACGFDFAVHYGELGKGYIEVHHLKPVHKMQSGQKTRLSDLALLCANCHRMAHRSKYPLNIEALKAQIRQT